MSKDNVTFVLEKVAKSWTSNRLYEIKKNGKVVLKLKDESDAKQVLDFLNKNYSESDSDGGKKGSGSGTGKKTTGKKSVKKTGKKTTGKKTTARKSGE